MTASIAMMKQIKRLSSIIAKTRQYAISHDYAPDDMLIQRYMKKTDEQLENYEDHKPENSEPPESKEEKVKMVSMIELFRFADGIEWLLLIVGILAAWIGGGCMPLMIVLFGDVSKVLIDHGAQEEITMDRCLNLTAANNISRSNFNHSEPVHLNDTIGLNGEEVYDEVKYFGVALVILGAVQLLLSYTMVACLHIAAERQVYRIRSIFLTAVLKQDIGWYDTYQTGEFASRTADDLAKLQDGIGEKIGMFNFFTSTLVLNVINAFFHGWKLTLVMLAVCPVMSFVMAVIGKMQAKFAEREMTAYASAGAIAEEVLTSIRTVIAFGGESKESARYKQNLVGATRAGINRGLLTAVGGGVMWIMMYGIYALAYWYGIGLILDDEYTSASFLIVFFCVLLGAMNMGQIAPYIEAFSQARAAAVTVFEIIDRVPVINSSSKEGFRPNNLNGNIEFEHVSFKYPTRPEVSILVDLNLRVNKGETIALVGASGCGKSTVVQLLQRFYDPIKGTVKLDGCDIKLLNVGWLRDHIGIVGQEPVLFGTTIAENIRYGLEGASMEDVVNAAKKANAHDFISKLPRKYETLVGDRGAQLSGGQKQRVAIARALIKNPKILLLDEATSALDSESEQIVQKALDKARQGRTTIIVAHRLSTIRNADKIAVFRDGCVREIGNHAELMALNGIYFQMVSAQASGIEESESSGSLVY